MMNSAVSIRVEAWGVSTTFSIADGTVAIEQPKKAIGKPATPAEATIDRIPVAPTPEATHAVATNGAAEANGVNPIA
jgi:hypothetical protein